MNKIIEEDIRNILSDETIPWGRFRDKSVLITGASGMLPSYMVYVLLFLNQYHKFNTRIYALVRNKRRAMELFEEWLDDMNFTLLVQDVCAPISISDDINFIIHAASQASPKYYSVDPVGTINANVLGTINTLNLARDKNVESYLFFSSGEVYGTISEDKVPYAENEYGYIDLLKVRSCYAESKRMGEQMCIAYCHQYGIHARIVRVFHTYGPCMRLDDKRVFADFVNDIVTGKNITLNSDGSSERAFCYISDAVCAYFQVLLCGEDFNAYNIANTNEVWSIRKFADILAGLYPDRSISVIRQSNQTNIMTTETKSPIKQAIPDCTKIFKLGWEPKISVKNGFRRTIDSIILTCNI